MNKLQERIIIVGGMGPQASLELHKRLLDEAVLHGAQDGHDFPEIVHISIPVHDIIGEVKSGLQTFADRLTASLQRVYLWR